jgi:hypothetical protein
MFVKNKSLRGGGNDDNGVVEFDDVADEEELSQVSIPLFS